MNLGKAGGTLEYEHSRLGIFGDAAELAVESGAALRLGASAVF